MAVNLKPAANLLPVAGVRLGTAEAAIKKPGRRDVTLLAFDAGTHVAATFTRNAFAAAPVQVARTRVATGNIRGLLINSGNANAGTGDQGVAAALAACESAGLALTVPGQTILPFSTGVIGEQLPLARLQAAIPKAASALDGNGWQAAAQAIMTTDTLPKGASRQLMLSCGNRITLTGIAKGSGMIHPDMATMLSFLATDAAVESASLSTLLSDCVQRSFNSITVDGDTSTNDACVLAATGQSPAAPLSEKSADWPRFTEQLESLMRELAQAIVRDGEGATRFITLRVSGAVDMAEARQVAFTVAHSPLVKTACFAGDPNWGRILAAVGRAGLHDLDIARVNVSLGPVRLVEQGQPAAGYVEAEAAAVMAEAEFDIIMELGRGVGEACVWTTDLSYEYVRINAEYRS